MGDAQHYDAKPKPEPERAEKPVPVEVEDPNLIVLSEPVNWNGMTVTELRFPKVLRAKHIRRLSISGEGYGMEQALKVASDCCNVPDKVLDEMLAKDASRVFEHVTSFLVASGFLKTQVIS